MADVSVPWRTLRPNPRAIEGVQKGTGVLPGPNAAPEGGYAFSVVDLWKRAMFGGIAGGMTGLAFGLMDAQKAVSSVKFKDATNALKTREGIRLTAMSGSMFGAYFAFYQVCKYGSKIVRGEDDFINVLVAAPLSVTPMIPLKETRQRFPYAVLLIAIDTLNSHVLQ